MMIQISARAESAKERRRRRVIWSGIYTNGMKMWGLMWAARTSASDGRTKRSAANDKERPIGATIQGEKWRGGRGRRSRLNDWVVMIKLMAMDRSRIRLLFL